MTQHQIEKYEKKLFENGLAETDTAIFAVAGAAVEWNRNAPTAAFLEPIMKGLDSSIVLYARPAEPYCSAIDYLARTTTDGVIRPDDSETLVFLTDLPVVGSIDEDRLLAVLKRRKCVIIPGFGIITHAREPSAAYVNFSAACFAGFVKFFSDILISARTGNIPEQQLGAFNQVRKYLSAPPLFEGGLLEGPFETETDVRRAIVQAGREVVQRGLVDACFGNISYRLGNTLYISASGSFLDHLEEAIVPVALDGSAIAGGKPSSELPTHREIASTSDFRAILHGHPLFSVILSMDCRIEHCQDQGDCHRICPHNRELCGIPIVSGEIGGGAHGLCTTVPNMIKETKGTIVYGHGVFTCASDDFNDALGRMVTIERICRNAYFEQIGTFIVDV